jgi:AcrR family transcriptional regulator
MTRAYRSELRAEQAERTREKIIEALAEQLGEGLEDFSIPRVAERAGVSVRTVYHHYPNRDAQIEAVARWLDQRIAAGEPPPVTLDDILTMADRVVRRAYNNQRLVRAQLVPGVAKLVRERRRRARERGIEKIFVAQSDPVGGRLAAAAFNVAFGADTGLAMLDRFGVDGEELMTTHRWMLRVLLDAVRRGDVPCVERQSGDVQRRTKAKSGRR